jgi:pyruvate/2-oxoglutarate dehydrogenase complex dihydrolipoamide dehydrogenase (E3) component
MAIKPAERKKRVVVVGGGPGGMSAARVAALRGHEVILYEKDAELGGQLRWARKALKRGEMEQVIRYLSIQVKKAGVDIHLNEEADLQKIYQANPDVVIMATGGVPYRPFIPGADGKNVYTYLDILSGKVEPGKRVVVIGGKLVGTQIAQLVASKGGFAILTEPSPAVCNDAGGRTKWLLLLDVNRNPNIEIHLDTSVERIKDGSVILQCNGKNEEVDNIDMVVLCLGAAADNHLAEELKWEGKLPEIHTIGDCSLPRKMTEAIYEGYLTALHI